MDDRGPAGTRLRSPGGPDEATGGAAREGAATAAAAGGRHRSAAPARLAEALALAAVSPLLPGVAHLRAGRIRTGGLLLTGHALLLAAAAGAAGYAGSGLLELAVRPGWLVALIAGSVAVAGLWTLLIVRSYTVLRPAGLGRAWRLAGGATVAVLCAVMAAPPLTLARYGHLQRDLVGSVFRDGPAGAGEPAGRPGGPERGPGAAGPGGDALAHLSRLDVLLIGGDADVTRPGLRTDSMTLASIDTKTGDTVLLSLPRNLQHVPVWSGRGRVAFPSEELLNAVYTHGTTHPEVLGHRFRDPGAELLKRTVGHILGRPVPYYAMVDMRSFRQIVDAMGGVRVCVGQAVPVPPEQVPGGVLRPGCRELDGREALWYARSRTGSSDYVRMGRQKCLLAAIARQAGPLTVLRSFQRLSRVFRDSVSTDLPRTLLPPLVELSGRVRSAEVAVLQFVPPLVSPGRPDYRRIRRLAARAVGDSATAPRGATELHKVDPSCT